MPRPWFPWAGREPSGPYRSLIAGLEEGVLFTDRHGAIVHFNPSALRILGLDPAELYGRPLSDPGWNIVAEDGTPIPVEAYPLRITLDTGEPQSGVVIGTVRPDGTTKWLCVSSRPLGDRSRGAVATFADITDRLELQQRLREVETRLRDTRRGGHTGSWELDLSADRVVCSLEMYRVFGMGHGDLAPRWQDFLQRLPVATRETVERAVRDALRNGTSGCCCGDVVEARAEIVSDGLGERARIVGTVEEVTAGSSVLTTRQREILGLLARGLTGDEIARRLYLSGETVRTHVRNAMERLGAHTRGQAIALAVARQEIVAPEEPRVASPA